MDARERLQRYLEQRREVGETELVLDSMSVDDVMALVGMRKGSAAPRPPTASPTTSPTTSTKETTPPAVVTPVHQTPPLPPSRLGAATGSDWRETLRAANPSSETGTSSTNAPPTPPSDATTIAELPQWLQAVGWPAGFSSGPDVAPGRARSDASEDATAALETLAAHIRACTACGLHEGARNAVPGDGNPTAELVCIGEAPGATEDEEGLPFVGESGQLLTKILGAIELSRESVFICNVVKHRPPGNRDPLPAEVLSCQPFLRQQLAAVQPRVILALGRFAAQTLLNTTEPLGKLRERIHLYHGIPVIATYHPAALLRNEAWKRPTWEDVKCARRILDLSRAADGVPLQGE